MSQIKTADSVRSVNLRISNSLVFRFINQGRTQSVWYMCASLTVYFLLTSNLMDSEFWRVKNTYAWKKGGSSSENVLCKDNTRGRSA